MIYIRCFEVVQYYGFRFKVGYGARYLKIMNLAARSINSEPRRLGYLGNKR